MRKVRLIIIGDEILSGRRQDKHLSKTIELLSERGMQLAAAEIISDDKPDIVATLQRSFATNDIVFCCGGIGATPDDQTRQGVAEALGLPLVLHPEAELLIAERCADMAAQGQGSANMLLPENQKRLQMGVFPQGAQIVPNNYNKIPGFFIKNHTFTPGFPVMAWPMIQWALDTKYSQYQHKNSYQEQSFVVFNLPESRITPALELIEQRWPSLKAFSLPSVGENGDLPHVELGVKGEPSCINDAMQFLRQQVLDLGGNIAV